MNTVLQLNNLTIGYRDKVVATNITANLDKGSLVCLVGRNGCGKSTLLRTIFNTPETVRIGSNANASIHHLISVVLTERVDVQNMSVRELVAMGRTPYTGFWGKLSEEDERIVDESIAMTGIEDLAGRMVHTLSDGERQKTMIAKALAQQTPIILLDEPTAFLDYPSKLETMQMLHRLCREQGKAVLISTHDLDIALRHCDAVWLMQDKTLSVVSPDSRQVVSMLM